VVIDRCYRKNGTRVRIRSRPQNERAGDLGSASSATCQRRPGVMDQFISSGETKWAGVRPDQYLPHGYEGQGPEHSSARLERTCSLCRAQHAVRVPTTAAQIFHLVQGPDAAAVQEAAGGMTPKSLLRKKEASASDSRAANGSFTGGDPELDRSKPRRERARPRAAARSTMSSSASEKSFAEMTCSNTPRASLSFPQHRDIIAQKWCSAQGYANALVALQSTHSLCAGGTNCAERIKLL